ncbi:thioredoxin-dependent thiol peroxidase [Arthrobacter woluwensis]|uniref:thioredoxin-dependent thiol peroxidase n=1 Tax=Arthrobacter woluwensis TaxID=156980 RepID=UPI001AAF935A|nr:thioredoxin-dependent thiol peroxidase [Arthrobacter woluwensis]QTF71926.1 thioredoxin-dependent thiol peroxidase [Arthrobacter woluwensis]
MPTSNTPRLTPGTPAPDFTLKNAQGEDVTLSSLRGQRVILYFYPQADTPACAQQACDFRDNLARFGTEGYTVLGISPDPVDKLAAWDQREHFGYTMLADEGHLVADRYAVWGEKLNYGKPYQGIIRSTFVIDEDGNVAVAQYNVRAKGHVAKLRRDLKLPA